MKGPRRLVQWGRRGSPYPRCMPNRLLGNLLCAVAGLLDNTGGLSGLVNQLDHILSLL